MMTEKTRLYVLAYKTHFEKKDLNKALEIYKYVMSAYPNSMEGKYSQKQIHKIVKKVVPNNEQNFIL